MINLFENNNEDFTCLLDQMGKDVTINDSSVRILITNTNLNNNYDDKKLSSLSPLSRGDIVVYSGKKYMVISEVNGQRYNKYKGLMRRLPHSITVNSDCRFISLDCYINVGNLGITDGKIISIQDGEITVYTTDHYKDSGLKNEARFILYGQAFKITGIDRFSTPGMIILTCEKDLINPAVDDVVNEIAGALACSIDITNSDATVFIGSSLQLNYTSPSGVPVTFKSSNDAVASVTDLGLVTGVSEGVVTITVYNSTNDKIHDSITVTVQDVPVSYTVSITSSSTPEEVYKGRTKTYNAVVNKGSEVITDQPVTWAIFADNQTSTTTFAKITSQDDTSCIVSGDAIGYVQMKVSLVSDPSIFTWLRIRVKSLI